jgi:hypothetical protein
LRSPSPVAPNDSFTTSKPALEHVDVASLVDRA